MHNKFFTDTPADKNPAEFNGSAPKNFRRKIWSLNKVGGKGEEQQGTFLLLSTKGKKYHVSVTGVFHPLLLVLQINQKLYIKGCRKVPLSGWNKSSLGFEAGKRKQQVEQTSEVVFFLLPWDTVCLILVFWKLGTLAKLFRILLQQRTSQRRESGRESVLSSLSPW